MLLFVEREKKRKKVEKRINDIYSVSFFLIFRITISVGKGSRLFLIRAGTNVLFSWWRKTRLGERVVVGPNCTKASVPNGGESRLYACPTTSGAVYRDESVCLKQKAFVFEHRLLFRRYTHIHTWTLTTTTSAAALCALKRPRFVGQFRRNLLALSFRVRKEKEERVIRYLS